MVLKLHSRKQWVSCHVKDTVLEHDPGGIIVKLHCTEYFIHLIHLIKSCGGFRCIHPFSAVNCRPNSQPKPGWLGCIVIRVTFLVHQQEEEKLKILFYRASADVAVRQPEHPFPAAANCMRQHITSPAREQRTLLWRISTTAMKLPAQSF